MPSRWTMRIHANALRSLYRIERGAVAKLTEVIDNLALDPTPPNAVPINGLSDAFELKVIGYTISYELQTTIYTIRILAVDPEIE